MIPSKPEFNTGSEPLPVYRAANAIFNKLNMAKSIVNHIAPVNEQLYRLLDEAHLLADAIVQCHGENSYQDGFLKAVSILEDARDASLTANTDNLQLREINLSTRAALQCAIDVLSVHRKLNPPCPPTPSTSEIKEGDEVEDTLGCKGRTFIRNSRGYWMIDWHHHGDGTPCHIWSVIHENSIKLSVVDKS